MKIMFGVPKKFTLVYKSDPQLILANLVKTDPEYAKVLKENFKSLVLDNGAYEARKPEGIEDLVRVAETLPNVTELVLPDIPGNTSETKKSIENALEWLTQRGLVKKWRLMAVTQGRTLQQRMSILRWMYSIPEITTIGLSAAPDAHTAETDLDLRRFLSKVSQERDNAKEYHILAFPHKLFLVYHFAVLYPWIRSCDSTLPMKLAYAGCWIKATTTRDDLYRKMPNYHQWKKRFFELEEAPNPKIVKHNFAKIRLWAGDYNEDA